MACLSFTAYSPRHGILYLTSRGSRVPCAVPQGGDPDSSQPNRIYVGNLPWSCDRDDLGRLLQQLGFIPQLVQDIEIVYDRTTGKSRGFGYVTMARVDLADTAMQKLDGYLLQGRSLKTGSSHPHKRSAFPQMTLPERQAAAESESDHTKLFVGNLPWAVDDGTLGEIFRTHGKVVQASVAYDQQTGRSRGFGFVTLSTKAEADAALKCLDGADCDGRELRLSLVEEPQQESELGAPESALK